ncbi:ADP-ribosylation factor GTPase-activating protein AGD3-like isoform X2 [Magnolia sinica]|nr:ADP-ribosylation factor GTPase-activating protein AGD3-like isoform X2 [Magnolia sinica]
MEAFQSVPIADSKVQLLEILKAKMRCLLRRSLLDHGFFSRSPLHEEDRNKKSNGLFCNFFFVLQACEKFLSLRKGTKSDVTAVLEEDHIARSSFEQAYFNLVTVLSNVEAKKRFEFLEAVSGVMDAHLIRYFKQVRIRFPCSLSY